MIIHDYGRKEVEISHFQCMVLLLVKKIEFIHHSLVGWKNMAGQSSVKFPPGSVCGQHIRLKLT